MRLPPFLRFLERRFLSDKLIFRGHIRVERQVKGGPVELVHDSKNFIVDLGLTSIRNILIGTNGGGFSGSIFRMAIGDGGCPPTELFNPRLPDSTWPAKTGLFHEVIRQDISVFTTPTASSMRFVASFNSVDVDVSSFSVASKVINEASLIIGDGVLTVGGDQKQINKTPPDTVGADERMMSMRTFKSAPFDPAEDVTVTVHWGITVATS